MTISTRDRRIVCLWLAGVKAEAIAAEFGTHRGVITRRARTLGLPERIPGANRNTDLWPCIVAWARAGYSAIDIARGIGCRSPDIIAGIGA